MAERIEARGERGRDADARGGDGVRNDARIGKSEAPDDI